MKVFFRTLSAILVAAVIIWFVFAAYQAHQARLKMRQLNQDTEFSKDRNFDPNAEKLTVRLKDAIDNDRPIPPNPSQTPETPATNNEQSQPPAPEIQSAAAEYVTLNGNVEVGHGTGKVVIPAGTTLPVVSRGSHIVVVRFAGEQQIIPESATMANQ